MGKFLRNLLIGVFALVLIGFATIAFVYEGIPTHNTGLTHFDTIIVLGTPAKPDGTPSPEQRERTLEGVREYKAGVAPNIIFTGGPAHNQFIEAHVMALLAESQGVPSSAVVEEGHAQNTIQNIFYSQQIMSEHGWNNAEVVSSPSHLPRTALILEHFPLQWRTHPASWPREYSLWQRATHYVNEAEGCFRLRLHGFPKSRFLPQPA